jgi:hypothetical protein
VSIFLRLNKNIRGLVCPRQYETGLCILTFLMYRFMEERECVPLYVDGNAQIMKFRPVYFCHVTVQGRTTIW